MKPSEILHLLVRILAALIMVQTLYFKFTGAEESVYIFTSIGLEPYGRIGIGVLELIASILLIYRPTSWMGAVLAIGLMSGAVFMHLTMLGIEVKGDHGYLFSLALAVAILSAIVVWIDRKRMLTLVRKFVKV